MNKPTPDDIRAAVACVETGNWVDSSVTPVCWGCALFDEAGVKIAGGCGRSAGEAMGLAWLAYWAPDGLSVPPTIEKPVPVEIPHGWEFRLKAPAEVDVNGAAVDRRPFLPADLDEFRRVVREAIRCNPGAVSLTTRLLRAMADAGERAATIPEVIEAIGNAGPQPPGHSTDPEGIAEILLRDWRVPLAFAQTAIRHELTNQVAQILAQPREAKADALRCRLSRRPA